MNYSSQPETPQSQVEPDVTNVGLLSVIGAFIGVVLLLIVVLMQAWFYSWKEEAAANRSIASDDPQTALGRAKIEQEEQINSYRWVQREAGVRAIPIQRAMDLVAKEMADAQRGAKK